MGLNRLSVSRVMAWSLVVVAFLTAAPAFGQGRGSVGDYYGGGPDGTIGRGTNRLPGGPSDWGGDTSGSPPAFGYYHQPRSSAPVSNPGAYYYYSPAPGTSPAQYAAAPYQTNRYYEPGDGYRYPLYFNPATRSYFYYPASRPPRG